MSELDLSDLMHDGDTLELGDGVMLRLRVEPDDIDPFENADCYGKIAPVERDRYNGYNGEKDRPDGFDGNAEKLHVPGNGGAVWWQPHPESPKRGTDEFKRERKNILDLLEYGCCGFVLELCDGEDAYHRPIVRHVASLWGIEPFPGDYAHEVVRDLYAEIEAAMADLASQVDPSDTPSWEAMQ